MLVWESGIKTTYYLRTLAASQVTKAIATQAGIEIVNPAKETNALLIAAEAARQAGTLRELSPEEKYNVCESCQ